MNNSKMIGLRWSPRPVKHYVNAAPTSSLLARYAAHLQDNLGVWNLFWISAAGLEEAPLTDLAVKGLYFGAHATSAQFLAGTPVGELAISIMPEPFVDLIVRHVDQASRLALPKLMGMENWQWTLRDRAGLFYTGRVSDAGLPVLTPELQNGTGATTIITLSKFRDRREQ